MSDAPDAFRALLKSRWFSQIRDLDVGRDMRQIIRASSAPISEAEFKWCLADAILNHRFSVEEYERLTDLDFETRADVAADLSHLWRLVFGDESIIL